MIVEKSGAFVCKADSTDVLTTLLSTLLWDKTQVLELEIALRIRYKGSFGQHYGCRNEIHGPCFSLGSLTIRIGGEGQMCEGHSGCGNQKLTRAIQAKAYLKSSCFQEYSVIGQ